MYNRYIPQPDGSYHRSRVENRRPSQPSRPPCKPPEPPCPPPEPPCPPREPERKDPPCREGHTGSAGGFLQNLLPQSFDTGDLIVVLLLLLLAGDCQEDRSTALLTLVLYLFM